MKAPPVILIVDDSELDRRILSKALVKLKSYQVIEVCSGESCLEYLATNPVELVILDIKMPGIGGSLVLEEIRKEKNPLELPVIMATAEVRPDKVVEALRMGANDYLTKPFNIEIALSRVATQLKLAETTREMARLQELEALHALVTTYNHEINNPLAIALGTLQKAGWREDAKAIERVEKALWRISEILTKVEGVIESKQVPYEQYSKAKRVIKTS